MAQVHGTCDDRFAGLKAEFQKRLDSGDDLGASITVNIDGKNVVDIWGGYTTPERNTEWQEDTILNVWSCTKTIIAMAVLILVDRGQIDVNENVAAYWPEFAANGKENVKVRHLLSHTSGLSGWEGPLQLEDIFDRELMTARLAAQAPWWEPGTASGYQAHTMGFLLGELVRRVAGKSMVEFVRDEIASPLGADFQIGALEKDWPRVAELWTGDGANGISANAPQLSEIMAKTLRTPFSTAAIAMTPEWRRADIGAANGHGNSRALARIMSAIALGGEVDGVRLLKPETIALIFNEQSNGVDLVLAKKVQFGTGYGICTAGDSAVNAMLPKGRVCFWSGWGGSMVVADTERRMTFSYTMNRMWINQGTMGNLNTSAYAHQVYNALGVNLQEEK